jgi:hypothetical protein
MIVLGLFAIVACSPRSDDRSTPTASATATPGVAVPADTDLWAALQSVSGGSWGGCVYDTPRIKELLAQGLAHSSTPKK